MTYRINRLAKRLQTVEEFGAVGVEIGLDNKLVFGRVFSLRAEVKS